MCHLPDASVDVRDGIYTNTHSAACQPVDSGQTEAEMLGHFSNGKVDSVRRGEQLRACVWVRDPRIATEREQP